MYYKRNKDGELIIGKGFMLKTDKDGQGIPYFSPHSKDGQKAKKLWDKLNNKNKNI